MCVLHSPKREWGDNYIIHNLKHGSAIANIIKLQDSKLKTEVWMGKNVLNFSASLQPACSTLNCCGLSAKCSQGGDSVTK